MENKYHCTICNLLEYEDPPIKIDVDKLDNMFRYTSRMASLFIDDITYNICEHIPIIVSLKNDIINIDPDMIIISWYEKEEKIKKPNDKVFINNNLCVDCYENDWTCNYCKVSVSKYSASFFNNKVCNKCHIIKFSL